MSDQIGHEALAVAVVSAFQISGLKLVFNSADHRPPHFHARKEGKWEIRVFFLLCTERNLCFSVKWPPNAKGPTKQERKTLLSETLDHRAELLSEWESKVQVPEEL